MKPFRFELLSLEDRVTPATFTVQNSNDSGAGSLRDIVQLANGNGETDTILFAPGVTNVNLTSGELVFTDSKETTIDGGGTGVTISRSSGTNFRLVNVNAGAGLILNRLTLQNGNVSGNGGAIFNSGAISVLNCTLNNNRASGDGGAIFNDGILRFLNLVNTTISGNTADGAGGGVRNNRGIAQFSNCTVTLNTSGNGGGGLSGNGENSLSDGGSLNNTIIAGNTDNGASKQHDLVGNFSQTRQFNNLIGINTGITGVGGITNPISNGVDGNIIGTENFPQLASLGALQFNGGPTFTHLPAANSLVLEAGRTQDAPAADQRGLARFPGSKFDIGAVERQFINVPMVVDEASDVVDGDYATGKLSLREAILIAGENAVSDEISFAPGISTITLNLGTLSLLENTTKISGGTSGVTITRSTAAGTPSFSIFEVRTGVSLTINRLTISKADRGGIQNSGTLTVDNCTITNNFAFAGGAISNFNDGTPDNKNEGTLTLSNSIISNNTGQNGGGGLSNTGTATITNCLFTGNVHTGAVGGGGGAISNGFIGSTSTLTIVNTTISGNSSIGAGGGIFHGGMFGRTDGNLTLINCTITNNVSNSNDNTTNDEAGGKGGGLGISSAVSTVLNNTLIAGNFFGTASPIADDVNGAITNTSKSNLIGSAANVTGISNGTAGNIIGVANAKIGPLANNGGTLQTHRLLAGSPALDAGDKTISGVTGTDQRSLVRSVGTNVDIGAFEVQAVSLAPTTLPNGKVGTAYNQALTASFTNQPTGTTYTFASTGTLPANVTVSSAGVIEGTPTTSGTFNFNVIATASTGDFSTTPFSLTIAAPPPPPPANTAPTAVQDLVNATAGTAKTINVLANDFDNDSDALVITATTNPANGVVSISGNSVIYTANLTFAGTDKFTYTISDGRSGTSTANVIVTVAAAPPVVPPPVAPPVVVPPVVVPPVVVPPVVVPPVVVPPTVSAGQFALGGGIGSGQVRFMNRDNTERFTITPFAGFTGGVRVASADFNQDGVNDLVVATGPGRTTQVQVLDGVSKGKLFQIDPFEAAFTGGIFVATGDLTGDGVPDLAISPDEGGGPRVRIFSGKGFGQVADFFGIEDPNFRGGARAAIGDATGDQRGDLFIVAGFSGGPRVAVWDGSSLNSQGALTRKPFGDFFAFKEDVAGLRNGVFVGVGDFNNDGLVDLAAGAGPGGGPRVQVLDLSDRLRDGNRDPRKIQDFFVGTITNRGGINIAINDIDSDGIPDLVTGSGVSAISPSDSRVIVFNGKSLSSGKVAEVLNLNAFPGLTGGVFVG